MLNTALNLPRHTMKSRFRPAMMRRPVFGRRTGAESVSQFEDAPHESRGMVITAKDVRQFLMAYTACLVVVIGMIA